jgi:hypothetical protein
MGLKEKGTILDLNHEVVRDVEMVQKKMPQAMIDVNIRIMCDSLYYTDEQHRKMIDDLREVIRKYI